MNASDLRKAALVFLAGLLLSSVAGAQSLSERVPEDVIGMIQLGPIEKAKEEFALLAKYSGFKQISGFFVSDLGEAVLNKQLTGVDESRPIAFVMLDPNEFDNPYAILVPVANRNAFLRSCKFKTKIRTVTPSISSALSEGGPVFIGGTTEYVVMAGNENACRKILDFRVNGKKSLLEKLKPAEHAVLDSANISAYFNIALAADMFDNNLEAAKFEILDMLDALPGTGEARAAVEAFRIEVECLFSAVKEMSSLCCALKISPEGMLLRAHVTALEKSRLTKLFKELSTPQKHNYLGLIPKDAFFATVWEINGESIRNYAKIVGREKNPKFRARWDNLVNTYFGQTPSGMLSVEQGVAGMFGPVRFPGVILVTSVPKANRERWDATFQGFVGSPTVQPEEGVKKVRGQALKMLKVSMGVAAVEANHGYVNDHFLFALNISEACLLDVVGALQKSKLPKSTSTWAPLIERLGSKPNLLAAVSVQTILRMIVAGMKTGPNAETGVANKVAVSTPGFAVGITFADGTAELRLWTSKQELNGIRNIWKVLHGKKPDRVGMPREDFAPPGEFPPGELPPGEEYQP